MPIIQEQRDYFVQRFQVGMGAYVADSDGMFDYFLGMGLQVQSRFGAIFSLMGAYLVHYFSSENVLCNDSNIPHIHGLEPVSDENFTIHFSGHGTLHASFIKTKKIFFKGRLSFPDGIGKRALCTEKMLMQMLYICNVNMCEIQVKITIFAQVNEQIQLFFMYLKFFGYLDGLIMNWCSTVMPKNYMC